jgi:hypothetical protein
VCVCACVCACMCFLPGITVTEAYVPGVALNVWENNL